MLETVAAALIALWLLALANAQAMGGLLHVPLLAALVVIVFRLLQGRGA